MRFILLLSISLLVGCQSSANKSQSVLINQQNENLNCQQLDKKIRALKANHTTDVFETVTPTVITPFQFKSSSATKVAALEQEARRKGCYAIPTQPSPTPTVNTALPVPLPSLLPSPEEMRQRRANETTAPSVNLPETPSRLSFDQCFEKCKQYTTRDDAACFDSCK